jgi:hypothetical protein
MKLFYVFWFFFSASWGYLMAQPYGLEPKTIAQIAAGLPIGAIQTNPCAHLSGCPSVAERGRAQKLGVRMTTVAFKAKCVVTKHPEGGCHLVGFADQEFDTKLYLMLQRAFEYDEQDVASGMDTYHVEWCGQEHSGYGGISKAVLYPSRLEVTFQPQMAEELGGVSRLEIDFEMVPASQRTLRKALEVVFKDSGCLEVADA